MPFKGITLKEHRRKQAKKATRVFSTRAEGGGGYFQRVNRDIARVINMVGNKNIIFSRAPGNNQSM